MYCILPITDAEGQRAGTARRIAQLSWKREAEDRALHYDVSLDKKDLEREAVIAGGVGGGGGNWRNIRRLQKGECIFQFIHFTGDALDSGN